MTKELSIALDKILSNYRKGNATHENEVYIENLTLSWDLTNSGQKRDVIQALYTVLADDGYIKRDTPTSDYIITAKGILFNEHSGYKKQWWTKNALTILRALQAFALVLGSLAALGLLILEWQKYHANCLC